MSSSSSDSSPAASSSAGAASEEEAAAAAGAAAAAFEGVVGGNRQSQDVLVVVNNRVTNRWQGWVTNSQGDGSNGVNGGNEVTNQFIIGDVQDGWWEDLTVVVNLNNSQTIGEWRDVQHVQQGSFGRTDLGVFFNNLDIGNNFNGTSGNLGWDTQSLEERSLTWFHTSVTGWNPDVHWSNGTGSGWSGNNVGNNGFSDGLQVSVGENETNVTSNERQQLFVFWQVRQESSQGSSNHGVLTHQDDGVTSQSLSDFVHLLGRNIVNTNNEDGLEFFQQFS